MTTVVQLEPFGLVGAVERRQGKIGRADDILVADDHQQRRRRDPLDKGSGLVFGVQLERSHSYLIAPLAKAPLILGRCVLSGEEPPRVRARMRGCAAPRRVDDHRNRLGRSAAKALEAVSVEGSTLISQGLGGYSA